MTRTQCLDGPAKVSGPICCGRFLLCRLSAASGERGQGARGCAGMVASARRSSWHGWEGTAGLSLVAVNQHLQKRRLAVSHRVSNASSLSYGVYTFGIGQECQHVMKGLIHGGRQLQRSQSSIRYDPH